MMTRDQMAYNEATADPIFLFQRARYVYFRDTMSSKGLVLDEEADYQVYDPEDPTNEKILAARKVGEDPAACDASLVYLTDEQLVGWECAVKHWYTESVFVSREESDAWGERRKYDHGTKDIGWRTYCVNAKGTLTQILNAWSDSSAHQQRPRPALPASPDPAQSGAPATV